MKAVEKIAAVICDNPKVLRLRFHPQAWVNDYAVEVDPEGPTDWSMPWEGGDIPADDSYESDNLIGFPGCPDWVCAWSGPFYVEVLNREELNA